MPSPKLPDGYTLDLAISQVFREHTFTRNGAEWVDGFLRELVARFVSKSRTIASQENFVSIDSSTVRTAVAEVVQENENDLLAKYMIETAKTTKYNGLPDDYLHRLCTAALVHMPGPPLVNGADVVLRRVIGYVLHEIMYYAWEVSSRENRSTITQGDCIRGILQDQELRKLAKKLHGVSLEPPITRALHINVDIGSSEPRTMTSDSRRTQDSLEDKCTKDAEKWFQHVTKETSPKRSHDEAFGSDVLCPDREWVKIQEGLCLDHKWVRIVATRKMYDRVYNGLIFKPEALIELQRCIEAHLGDLLRKSVELYHHRQGGPCTENEEDKSWKSLMVRDVEAAKKQMMS